MERKLTISLDIDEAFLGSIDYFFDDLDDDIKAAIKEACTDAGEFFVKYRLSDEPEEV